MNHKLTSLVLMTLFAAACTSETTGKPPAPGNDDPPMDDHGTDHVLGELQAGSFTMTVTQFGDVEAGKEGAFDLAFPEGSTRPDGARAWVGIETSVGSRKGKLMKEPGNKLHGHVDVPDPIPQGSKFWVEIELDSGPVRGSVALHQ